MAAAAAIPISSAGQPAGPDFTLPELQEAWARVRDNRGCAGADGVTLEVFARDVPGHLRPLLASLHDGSYRPLPLLTIVVEKQPGSAQTRTLLVPAVRDRILQTAAARRLHPALEEEFLDCSFAYRPGRGVDRALARIRYLRTRGYTWVLEADIESFFDRIDHALLLERFATLCGGKALSGLLRLWLAGPVWDGMALRPLRSGIPQGSPISPLLSNWYLQPFDLELEKAGHRYLRYGDDFIVQGRSRDEAEAAWRLCAETLVPLKLELKPAKTRITTFEEGFRFLGAIFSKDQILIPWKWGSRRGRVIHMAGPLPAALRQLFLIPRPEPVVPPASRRPAPGPNASSCATDTPEADRGSAMAYLYLTHQGSVLRKTGSRFVVENDGAIVLDLPYHKLEAVLAFGGVQVTSQAMGEMLERGVRLSLFSRHGHFRGALEGPRGKNVPLRLAQFEAFRDAGRALAIARAIVGAKLRNAVAVLRRLLRSSRSRSELEPHLADALRSLDRGSENAATAGSVAQLDGIEGAGARAYFSALMRFNRSELAWPGRVRHPATDPLNSLLSLGYTLLMNEAAGLLEGLGLDACLGFLHQMDYGRPSLALDLIEAFRHPMVDRFTLSLVNRKVFTAGQFRRDESGEGLHLEADAVRRYFAEYERWVLFRAAGTSGQAACCFRDLLRQEAEKMVAALRNRGVFEPYLYPVG